MRLPIATIVTFGLLSTFAACSSSSPSEPRVLYDSGDLNSTAVILHDYYSGLQTPERVVVRDQSHWASVWDTTSAYQIPVPPVPTVDFSQEMVIVAALGAHPTGGYDISIDSVVVDSGAAEVFVVATAPGTGCVTTQAVTQPVTMLKIAAIEGAVRFHERTQTQSCG